MLTGGVAEPHSGLYRQIKSVALPHRDYVFGIFPTAEAGGYLKDCGAATAGLAYIGF